MQTQKPNEEHSDSVPLHRSYGCRKKETLFDRILLIFYRILATAVLLLFFGTAAMIVGFAAVYVGTPVILPLILLAIFLLIRRPCRLIRKRRKFIKQMKKFCREHHFQLTQFRGFFAAMRYVPNVPDFALETESCVYYGKYLTCPQYHVHLTFLSADRIRIKKGIISSRFQVLYGVKNQDTEKKFLFAECPSTEQKKSVRIVLLNPVPHSMFVKNRDGEIVASGTGERMFGYVICSGNGFLESVRRETESKKF